MKDSTKKPATLPTLTWYPAHSKVGVDFAGTATEASEVIEFIQFQLKPEVDSRLIIERS
jgi:hypothetical protein